MARKKLYNVGILGATGAVGQQMMACLEERKFPVKELRLFGSERSAGKKVTFAGQKSRFRNPLLKRSRDWISSLALQTTMWQRFTSLTPLLRARS